MQLRRLWSAIHRLDADQNILRARLGVLNENVEIAIVIENPRVDQFEFEVMFAAAAVFFRQALVGKLTLRVLVEKFHVGVRRRRIEIEIIFLDVFAVIAFVAGEAEEALLENRVLAVPEGQREADILMAVADTSQAVFAPAVGAAARMVVSQVAPNISVGAVVFAHGAPLALR